LSVITSVVKWTSTDCSPQYCTAKCYVHLCSVTS